MSRIVALMTKSFLIVFLSSGVSLLYAQRHDVGRASVMLNGPGWEPIQTQDKGVAYSGEISGTIPSESKLFVNKSVDGQVLAIIHVRVSKGGIGQGYFTYSPTCSDKDASFAEGNKGPQAPYAQCLLVYPQYTTVSLLAQLDASERKLIEPYSPVTPKAMRSVFAIYRNQNGSFAQVHVFMAPQFVGVTATEVNEAVDAYSLWGKALMQEVRSSVNSFSGKLNVPSMAFKSEKLVFLQEKFTVISEVSK